MPNEIKSAPSSETLAAIRTGLPRLATTPAVIGFDAFVDESIQVVGKRQSPEAFEAIATISEFSQWAGAAAGRSGSREFVFQREPGGCSINMGDGLITLGCPVDAFCGVGKPAHPAFEVFLSGAHSNTSLGMEPGRALVFDFEDGKLMFCAFNHFNDFAPGYLRDRMGDGSYRRACEQANAVVLTSWSVYPHMTDCWRLLQKEVLAGLEQRPRFFFDLADPASRPPEDLVDMADALGGFEPLGPVTLSLNGNEANQLARALGLPESAAQPDAVLEQALALREKLDIDEVGIHCIPFATAASASEKAAVDGPYCAKPRKSVGAGDRFNAGYLAGHLLGLTATQRLTLGCAASGFFVRQGCSGSANEISEFVGHWHENSLQ